MDLKIIKLRLLPDPKKHSMPGSFGSGFKYPRSLSLFEKEIKLRRYDTLTLVDGQDNIGGLA